MASCPFCRESIDESLAVFGGTCPHCFADVPGEEAATDPGEEVKAEMAAADRKRANRRAMLPVLIATPLVLAVVGVAAYSFTNKPVVEELVFDEDAFSFEIDLADYEAPAPDEAPADAERPREASVVGARPRAPAGGSEPGTASLADRLAAADRPVDDGTTRPDRPSGSAPIPQGNRDIGEVGTAGAGSTSGLELSVNTERKAALLTSRSDVESAFRDMMRGRQGRLQLCYERSLKANPSLQGAWRLSFTIDTEGRVTQAAAVGEAMSDAAFEKCLVREMSDWRIYGRLGKPWPVSFPVRFKGG